MSSLVDEAVNSLGTAVSNRRTRASLVTTFALSLIVVHVCLRAWAVYGGWFIGDDLVFLSDAAQGKTGHLSWYFHRHNVHFMPVGFVLVAIVSKAGSFNWAAAATEIIVLQTVASLCCWWMLRTLFGNRPRILIPLAFYLFCAISMPAIMWWASAINFLPVQIAAFTAVTTHVVYLRTGKRRYAVLATLAFGLGLFSYVKAILIPVVLGVLALSYFAEGSLIGRLRFTIRRFWVGWALYAVSGATYLLLYATHGEKTAPAAIKPDYLSVANDSLASSLSTGLVGGPWRWLWLGPGMGPRLLSGPPQILTTSAILVIIALIVYAACRFHGALKPLGFIVPFVVVSYLAIATGRSAAFGAGASLDIRYWTDLLPFAALAIGLMIMPLRGATDPLRARESPLITAAVPLRVWAVVAVVFLTGSIYSSFKYVEPWHSDFATRQFITTAQSQFAARKAPVVLADQNVPDTVMPGLLLPYNQARLLFAPISHEFTTPAVATDLEVLDSLGLLEKGRVDGGMDIPPVVLGDCLVGTIAGKAHIVELGAKTYDYPFWLGLSYRSDRVGTLDLVAGETARIVPIERGTHTLFVKTEGAYDSVAVTPSDGVTLCMDALRIGPTIVPQ